MQTLETKQPKTEAAILSRVLLNGKNELSPATARLLLGMGFTEEDKARLAELAGKGNEGILSAEERAEYEAYVKVGDVLSLLHLKARKFLGR